MYASQTPDFGGRVDSSGSLRLNFEADYSPALRLSKKNILRTNMAEYQASNSGDRVHLLYLANRHELLAYGRIMKRKSEKLSTLKRNFMKLTDNLHGKLKAVNLTLRRFELPRIQILFKCDRMRHYCFKQRIGSGSGKNEGNQSCDKKAQLQPLAYHSLKPYDSDDDSEEELWGENPVHDFHPATETF